MRRQVKGGEGRTGSAERVNNQTFVTAPYTHTGLKLSLIGAQGPIRGPTPLGANSTAPLLVQGPAHLLAVMGHRCVTLTPTTAGLL